MEDFSEEMISNLSADGSLEDIVVDVDGEVYLKFNMELLEALHPTVYQEVLAVQKAEFEATLSGMVDKGLLDMSFKELEDGTIEAVYSMTEKGRRALGDAEF